MQTKASWRKVLRDRRRQIDPSGLEASALIQRMLDALTALSPRCVGFYWAQSQEPDIAQALARWARSARVELALPFSSRQDKTMHYLAWTPDAAMGVDTVGIPAPLYTAPKEPDVLVVPCVGFHAEGFRLGYGGGYFDRYLERYPQCKTVGLAYDALRLEDASLFEPTDKPLDVICTETRTIRRASR